MAAVEFPSHPSAEVIGLDFVRADGGMRRLRLLVDSGFTGASSFVIATDSAELVQAAAPTATASGALHGPQVRGWVTFHIPELGLRRSMIAILADLESLALPPGIDGLVGLTFLRQFRQWGAERNAAGAWRFVIENNDL